MIIKQLIVYQPVKIGNTTRNSFNIADGYVMQYCENYVSIAKDSLLVCVGISNVAQFTPESLENKLESSKSITSKSRK